jgi:hypothetical protein
VPVGIQTQRIASAPLDMKAATLKELRGLWNLASTGLEWLPVAPAGRQ